MSILVLAEQDKSHLSDSTLSVISAAKAIGNDIDILIAGVDCDAVSQAASGVKGITRVLVADDSAYQHQLAENAAALLAEVGKDYTHILAAATTSGKNILPRAAALLNVGMLSDVIAVDSLDTFKRPVYAGNAVATVQSLDPIKVLTVRASSFDADSSEGGDAEIQVLDHSLDQGLSSFVSEELAVSDRPELTAANIVISGGRGLQNGENFEQLYQLADKLGAAVGASRAAVDAGFVPNDMQVGQTGKIVAPDLYMAFGISGAIQHLAGMKDSKVIVAVNKDEDAPIFQVADYGLVADLFDVLPELERLVSSVSG